MYLILLLLGLAGLWAGTELTIRGAVSVAARLGISEFVVGVALLSVGSDLPELAIAVDGAIKNLFAGDASNVVVGTAIGSYLGQLALVLGLAALLLRLSLPKDIVYRHGGALLGSLILLGVFGLDGIVTRLEGATLVFAYLLYLVALFADPRGHRERSGDAAGLPLIKMWLYLLAGLVIVVGSAELTVTAAIGVARQLQVSDAFVAIVVIGLGTSLPELSISVGAAAKQRAALSVGNLIGSNVFDTLVPIGVAAIISTIGFDADLLRVEIPVLLILTVLVMVFFLNRRGIQRSEALALLAFYLGYLLIRVAGFGA